MKTGTRPQNPFRTPFRIFTRDMVRHMHPAHKKIPGIPGTDDEMMEQARSGLLNNGYPYFDLSFIAENISNEMTGETLDETPNEEPWND